MGVEDQDKRFIHQQYRHANVVHLINRLQEEEFYYHGKPIDKQEADQIVMNHLNISKEND